MRAPTILSTDGIMTSHCGRRRYCSQNMAVPDGGDARGTADGPAVRPFGVVNSRVGRKPN